ncbi:hypothetical protein DMB65_17250 [Flavobacterium cheongpyeongense]|uniref:DUF3990 domain-containing protein n=1 Tax=Flavobacterium cheongpyeongense TaxID=2212651 RepID=A0A2V4BKR8_9FLAO|nr:hypothetical protein [Flavobacterium cheongpyeongense]PXY39566.1 hypothetical protein DMB65_17250 [Flavobacterium cheongpyeongense]
MYTTKSGLILGFHGCDENIAIDILLQKIKFKPSENKYDWLGKGMYFWEDSPSRAEQFITHLFNNPQKDKPKIVKPSVLGATIDLGHCLDLTDYYCLQTLKDAYEYYYDLQTSSGWEVLKNTNPKPLVGNPDNLWRQLDCAVINLHHKFRAENKLKPYDSVRGIFVEGEELYPTAGFRDKNHIQLSIINPNCIKGFFLPRDKV